MKKAPMFHPICVWKVRERLGTRPGEKRKEVER